MGPRCWRRWCSPSPRADAALTSTQIPDYRGEPGTAFCVWDFFNPATTDVSMPILRHSGTGNPTLSVSTPNNSTQMTGSSSLYNFVEIQTFSVMDSVAYDLGVVTFQTRRLGFELGYANVTLTYVPA